MRTIVIGPKDYAAIQAGDRLTVRGGSTGLVNGDRVRLIKRDMCDHEGLAARIVSVQYDMSKGGLQAIHALEADD